MVSRGAKRRNNETTGWTSRSPVSECVVMPGLDPGIHSVMPMNSVIVTEWIAGSSPAMTTEVSA
jgi:hypothetical protein